MQLQILKIVISLYLQLFIIGGVEAGYFFELIGKVCNTAVL